MASTATAGTPARTAGAEQAKGDVLVVFGITGDLAKVMTFRSLYRLEARGLLDCPIVGVAVDDWSDGRPPRACAHLDRGHRRDRSTRRCSTASRSASPTFRGTSPTRPRTSGSAAAIDGTKTPVFYLEIPPFLFGQVVKELCRRRPDEGARVVVEKPFGHDLESARALAAELHQYIDESQLYRIDHYLGKMGARGDPPPPVPELDPRAALEPELRRQRSRSPWPSRSASRTAATSTTRSERCATSWSTTSCRWSRRPRWRCPRGPTRTRSRTSVAALFHSVEPADPAHYVRGQYDGYRDDRRRRRRLDDRDVRRASPRHRELALVRRAVLHPHRQAAPGHPDRAPPRLQAAAPPRLLRAAAQSEANQLVVKLDPSTGIRVVLDAHRADVGGSGADHARHGVRRGRRRGADSLRGAPARRDRPATARASRARTASRRRGGSCSRCSTRRRPFTPTPPARGGPRRPTASSPATAAGTSPGSRARGPPARERSADDRRQGATTRPGAAERGRALAVPADRGLRVPVRLPHRRPRRPRRRDRLAVHPVLRRPQRLRQPPRPGGGLLPLRPVRDLPPDGTRLPAGDERLRDHVEDAVGLGHRARRPHARSTGSRGHGHAAHAASGRRRRRPHARPDGRVPRRQYRDRARLRARLRLRPYAGGLDAGRRGTARSRRLRGRRDVQAGVGSCDRRRGRFGPWTPRCRPANERTAPCRGPKSSPPRRTTTRRRRASTRRRASGAGG